MPNFIFQARNSDGDVVQGEQSADSEAQAIRILQGKDLIVTRIAVAQAQEGTVGHAAVRGARRKHRRIRQGDLLLFIRETATLIDAGVPLLQSLDVVSNLVDSERLTVTIREIRDGIRGGSTFTDALASRPRVFPPLWAHLVRAGETSGNLPLVLRQLAEHIESGINVRKKVVSALIYPAILIGVSIVAILVFLLRIIPIFSNLFKSFHAELPLLTRMVMHASDFLRNYFLYIAFGFTGLALYFRYYASTVRGRRSIDTMSLKLPLVSTFVRDAAVARITSNLSTLIKSGVNLLEALDITARASGNYLYELAIKTTAQEVQQGMPLSDSLSKEPLFPVMFVQMTKIGEESGKLGEMMDRVALYYQARVDVFLTRLSVMIEPIILILVGGIIGVLVVSMFLPIFSLSTVVR